MTDTQSGDETLDEFLGTPAVRPWRKWAVRVGAGLALLLALLLLARCFGGSETTSYATGEVRRGDLTVTVSATGNLKPVNQVDVGSEQSGLITRVLVDVNDRVSKGQLLAMLDTSRLEDTVRQTQAQVASAQAQLAQAQAQAALADATLARQEDVARLSGGRVPSRTELDSARAQARSARANVQAAQAQVAVARAQLSSAQINLSKARIVSPVTGVVLSRDVEPGQTVAASLNAPVLFTIAEDLSQMEVEVAVDEADVGQVGAGQEASFTVDAFPGRRFPARITRVNMGSTGTASSTSSSTSSATVVSYKAVLAVDNREMTLRPGMTATADIVAQKVRNALLVPNAALRFTPATSSTGRGITGALLPRPRSSNGASQEVSFGAGSRQTVYVRDAKGEPQPVSVTIGESDGTHTVVTGGKLRPGQQVITGQLANGQGSSGSGTSAAKSGSGRNGG